MYCRLLALLAILATLVNGLSDSFALDFDQGGVSVTLLHALDDSETFTFRGNLTVSGRGSNIVQEPLSPAERQSLKSLAEKDSFYRLKAIVTYTDGSTASFLTFSKACVLAKAQLMDNIWISLDNEGSVVSVSQLVRGSAFCKNGLSKGEVDALDEFNTDVLLRHVETAPIPDTASFIQKMERERESREKGETKDTRGFFAKYWMYIVPAVIILLISGTANQEGGAARQ